MSRLSRGDPCLEQARKQAMTQVAVEQLGPEAEEARRCVQRDWAATEKAAAAAAAWERGLRAGQQLKMAVEARRSVKREWLETNALRRKAKALEQESLLADQHVKTLLRQDQFLSGEDATTLVGERPPLVLRAATTLELTFDQEQHNMELEAEFWKEQAAQDQHQLDLVARQSAALAAESWTTTQGLRVQQANTQTGFASASSGDTAQLGATASSLSVRRAHGEVFAATNVRQAQRVLSLKQVQ